jgi:hypothetical protein
MLTYADACLQVRPVMVEDARWPKLKHIQWEWKNVSEEEVS